MRFFFPAVFIILQLSSTAQGVITLQDKPFVYTAPVDSALWKSLKAEPSFKLLTNQEQMLFYWTNVFRKDPRKFFSTAVKEFIKQFPEANSSYLKSLERDIQKAPASLPLLLPDAGLGKMSKTHSSDLLGRGGIISHKSSSGKDFVQRIRDAGMYRCGAENIFVGTYDPLEALIALLIDQGVADKGHRMNLLDVRFERMGVSFSVMNTKRAVLVQDFACK
jgi:hypothetical protein